MTTGEMVVDVSQDWVLACDVQALCGRFVPLATPWSNGETHSGVNDIGQHPLDARVPLYEPSTLRQEIVVDPKMLEGYVGSYALAEHFTLTITRQGSDLSLQATGQPKEGIVAETDREFFLKVVDARATFVADHQGRAIRADPASGRPASRETGE